MARDAKMIALAVGTTVAVGAALAVAIRKSNEMHQSSNVEDDESSYVYQEEELEDDCHHYNHNFEPLGTRTPSFTFAGSPNKKKQTKTKPTSRNMQFHSCPVCDSAKEEMRY
jgi:hypothetical protein